MDNILYIVIAVIAFILVLKFAGKILKVIFSVLFIGFVVYMLLGTDMLSSISEYLTSLNMRSVSFITLLS